MSDKDIHSFLEKQAELYNRTDFIELDPISVPHRFSIKQDIEIAGLFAAIFAWGNRKTIIAKCTDLLNRMDNAPHQFIIQHSEKDLLRMKGFVHRTFNETDLLYFIYFLQHWYKKHESLELAFSRGINAKSINVEHGLNHFRRTFVTSEFVPSRTLKHVASPSQHSACKRLNMYLRWMVRKDKHGVDFGIWKRIKPSQLVIPLDVHVMNTAILLGLLQRDKADWNAAIMLTEKLKTFRPNDPVYFDYALFGTGVNKFQVP